MKIRLADNLLRNLSELGQAFDIGRSPAAFDGGRVGFLEPETEKESDDDSSGQRGPAAESRQGTAGRQGASDQGSRFGRAELEALYLAGLDDLRSAYPTLVFRVENGLWLVVRSRPLGTDGPQVVFVVAVPFVTVLTPRAWGFWRTGPCPAFIGPRHTNFPDASICAFGVDDGAWAFDDGLVRLIDLYSSWVVRHLYYMHFERWPGRQHGLSALYRRTEFHPDEWCGCGARARYRDCHQTADTMLNDEEARAEHIRVMGLDYCKRLPPACVTKFVRSSWKKPPALKQVF